MLPPRNPEPHHRRPRFSPRSRPRGSHPDALPVSILGVYRGIYAKALPALYTALTFEFDEPTTFIFFTTRCIPCSHLSLIRSLSARFHIKFNPPLFPIDSASTGLHPAPYRHAQARWLVFWGIMALCLPALERLKFVLVFEFVDGRYWQWGYSDWDQGKGWKGWGLPVLGVCGLKRCEVDVEEVQGWLFDSDEDDGMEALREVKGRFLAELNRLLCRERRTETQSDVNGLDVRAVLRLEHCRGKKDRLRAVLERPYRALVSDLDEDMLDRLLDASVWTLMNDTIHVIS